VEKFLLVHVNAQVLAYSAVVLSIVVSLSGLFLVRRSVALSTLEAHNDVAGFIIAVIGVLYAVLLAFVVVVSWQNFDRADQIATHEAEIVEGLYRDASVFGVKTTDIRRSLDNYGTLVVTKEWPAMQEHQREDTETNDSLDAVWDAYRSFTPANATEEAFYSDSIRRLNDLQAARADRLDASDSQLPTVLWGVLIGGAIITIGFTYFFGVSNLWAHALMVAALSAIISLTLFLVLSLDLPFSGDLAVRPTAMSHAVADMHRFGGFAAEK
jgi:Protein of unknown function (DUF4239)